MSSEIGHLTQLKHFGLGTNRLTGTLPFNAMSKLTNLEVIDVSGNTDLSGPLLQIAASAPWSKVLKMVAKDSAINGPIPSDISKLNKLELLSLGDTKISGSFPEGLFDLTNLKSLSIGSDFIENATISPRIGSMTFLSTYKDTQAGISRRHGK